jgi:hypothetical protein
LFGFVSLCYVGQAVCQSGGVQSGAVVPENVDTVVV